MKIGARRLVLRSDLLAYFERIKAQSAPVAAAPN